MEGPSTIAAIILESIPGTAGIMVPPPGYIAGVRALCDEYGIILIADEVMAGFGRSGKWFSIDHFDVTPDLLTFAKGVNSGYVPLGGVAISPAIADTFAHRAYPGGLTYSGHPLATAAAVATINAMAEEGIVENAARIGSEVLGPALRELAARHRCVGEVRGAGVFWAVELVADQQTREPLAPYGSSSAAMNTVIAECKKSGLLPFANYNRIHVVPPCIVTEELAREGVAILDRALDVADAALEQLAAELAGDAPLEGGAGTFGQHDQPVEFAARQPVGPLAFLRRRCGVGRNPQQALGAGQALLLLVGEAGAPSSDRFGFGDVERGDVLLDGIKVVAGGVAVVDEVRDAGGTEEVRPHLGPVEALGARVAHIGHQREVEQLGHVQLVLQPPGVGPVMFLDRAGDRAPRCCVVPGRGAAGSSSARRARAAAMPRNVA